MKRLEITVDEMIHDRRDDGVRFKRMKGTVESFIERKLRKAGFDLSRRIWRYDTLEKVVFYQKN